MVFPWESLIGNNLAFLAFEAQELLDGAALLLPRGRSVIDIPAGAPCSAELIVAAQDLKNAGYRIALSGWRAEKERRPRAVLH